VSDRSFSIRFALYALVAFALTALISLPLDRANAQRRAIGDLEAQAQTIASILGPQVRPGGLDRGPTPEQRRRLVLALSSRGDLLWVRLVSRSGKVAWASRPDLTVAGAEPSLRDVLAGKTDHERITLSKGDARIAAIEARVPIVVTGRIGGALEVYRPWAPIAADIRADALVRTASIAVALALLYAALIPILRRLLRERRAAESKLRSRERLSEAIVEHAAEGIWVLGADGCIEFVNPTLTTLLGYPPEEMIGRRIADFALIEPAESGRQELMLRRADGTFVWTLISTHALGEDGAAVATIVDIQDLKGTEESLHGATRRLSAIVRAQREIAEHEGTLDLALQTVVDTAQALTEADAGFVFFLEGDELVVHATSDPERVLVGNRIAADASLAGTTLRTGAVQTSGDTRGDQRIATGWRTDGIARSVVLVPLAGVPAVLGVLRERTNAFADDAVETVRLMAEFASVALRNAADAEERQGLVAALAAGEERFRNAIESSPIGFALCTPEDEYLVVNEAYCKIVGRTRDELEGLTWRDFTHPDDLDAEVTASTRLVEGSLPHVELERRMIRGDGSTVWVRKHISMVRREDGGPAYGLAQVQDVTEQRLLARSAQEREQLFRAVFEQSLVATLLFDDTGRIVDANGQSLALLGPERSDLIGKRFFDFPVDPSVLDPHWEQLLRRGATQGETDVVGAGGSVRTIIFSARANVQPGRHLSTMIDVTEQRRLEERLRQGQKLEAIGRLAGGVAHDFNNMLTAISAYAELLLAGLEPGSPLHGHAGQIEQAAQRASGLTRQLLAFSRRQVLQPEVLDLNAIVEAMRDMVTRLIGEHVRLETALDPDAAHVVADEGQLEQVIVNLAVNARDAMPRGGTLRFETGTVDLEDGDEGEIPAGRYTTLTITDSGVGMGSDQLERLFEPFYSTKEQAGVGLGLATVYGIVSQSGGLVTVSSEPGHGSRFRIFLPASSERAERPQAPPPRPAATDGSGTILLVEDEPAVRAVVAEMLKQGGYAVLAAADGAEALRLAAGRAETIDLLVTDVVMPGMSGQEVARRIADDRPAIRTLFVSGYNEEAVSQHGVLAPGTAFLEKPFTAAELTEKTRELLDPEGRLSSVAG
jgi:PAS domain S-box-containing protein